MNDWKLDEESIRFYPRTRLIKGSGRGGVTTGKVQANGVHTVGDLFGYPLSEDASQRFQFQPYDGLSGYGRTKKAAVIDGFRRNRERMEARS